MNVVLGVVIGSAIFLVPATLLRPQPSPLAALLAVGFAGVLSWFGALAYAEIGAMLPDTGGEYVYLRESWGGLAAFLLGWGFFWVIQSGGIAALSVGFATLLGSVVPMGPWQAKAVAVGLIAVLTAINVTGVQSGARFTNVLNVLKVGGMVWMIGAIAVTPARAEVHWTWPADWTFLQFSAALVPALWAFEGWNMLPCVAGELRNPQRNLPRAQGLALGLVLVLYALALWMYLRMLPVGEIVRTESAATAAITRALSPAAVFWVTLTMLTALVSSTNSSILGGARVYYAQALDGLFFRPFAKVQARFKTPWFSLVMHGVWSAVLAASGTYETLFSYCIFGAWIFYGLTVAGVLVLRRKYPERPRPYRVFGYPWAPLLFVATSAAFVLSCFVTNPVSSFIGLALIASGVPFYFFWRRRARHNDRSA